jgi:hypothetical protein
LFTLPGRTDIVAGAPGVWKLEEMKRWLGVSNLAFYEQFGYTTFFSAFNTFDTTILPEDNLGKVLRPLVFYAVGLNLHIDFTGIWVDGNIAPIPVKPFLLPFAGPRMRYTWTSVPEGYQIPYVQNDPLFDYRGVLRANR